MTHMLKTAAADVRSQLMREREARAHGSKGRGNAHFAAVMGGAIDTALTESPAYCIADLIDQDTNLQAKLKVLIGANSRGARREAADVLNSALANHVRWTLGECRTSLHDCLNELVPRPSESSSKSDPSSGDSSKDSTDEASGSGSHSTSLNVSAAAKATDTSLDKLDLLIESGVSEEVPEEVSQTRLDFHERQQFVSAKAEELNIVIQALAECDSAISKLKSEWTGPYRDLYRSNELEELQEERGRIAKDQSHHETALQRYFGSVTASTSKGEKTDKVFKLTLATDLETRKAGFRQIQLVDLYCLSRGKELWAILPSITRIGHDIDPIKCMHWRPDVKTMPEALQSFWREQSRAFAKQLLMLCTPTQRSTLLGAHEFGTKKVSVKAPECKERRKSIGPISHSCANLRQTRGATVAALSLTVG